MHKLENGHKKAEQRQVTMTRSEQYVVSQCLLVSSRGGSMTEQKIKETAAMVTGAAREAQPYSQPCLLLLKGSPPTAALNPMEQLPKISNRTQKS